MKMITIRETGADADTTEFSVEDFAMGADLSYVNQILDHGGTYRDSGSFENL